MSFQKTPHVRAKLEEVGEDLSSSVRLSAAIKSILFRHSRPQDHRPSDGEPWRDKTLVKIEQLGSAGQRKTGVIGGFVLLEPADEILHRRSNSIATGRWGIG
jgi:hypothetical protein